MSVKALNYVFEHSASTGSDRLVMLALADQCNDDGFTWIGLDRLSKKTRLSKRQVIRCIVSLTANGMIMTYSRKDDKQARTLSNLYYLPFPGTTGQLPEYLRGQVERKMYAEPTPRKDVGQQLEALREKRPYKRKGSDTLVTPPVTRLSPEPSLEPDTEKKKRALPEKNGNGTHLEVTEQHIAQSDTPAPKRKRDPQYDAIAEVFDTDVSGKIVNLQGQLFHSKRVRGEWESMKIHPPMTIDELREWARWERKNMRRYADGQERMPATPEVIARHIEDWRRLRNPSPEPQYAFEPDWTKQRPETPEDPQPWNPLYDKNDPKTWVKKPDFWGQPYKYVLVEDDAPAPEPVDVSSIPF